MRNINIILLLILYTVNGYAFSYQCTPEDLQLNGADFVVFRKKSSLDSAAVWSGIIAISPSALHSGENPNEKKDEGKIGFALAGFVYSVFGSRPSACQNWTGIKPAPMDIASVRNVYERAKRRFWISYALSSVTLYNFATESIYEDRRTYAKVAFLFPLALTFLGEWNLFHAPTDEEISPLLVTSQGEIATGLGYRFTF